MSDPHTEPETQNREDHPKGRFSARAEPFWLNPATIKGTISIGAGLLLLINPEASLTLLRWIIGVALILSGITDLWFRFRRRGEGRNVTSVGESLLTIGAGLLILLYPEQTARLITTIAAIYLIVRGVVVSVGAIQKRGQGLWGLNLARGVFLAVFGLVLLFIPEAVVMSLTFLIGALIVVLGAIVLAYGIHHHSEDELADVDAGSVTQIIRDWMMLQDVGDERRTEIDDGLYFEQPDRTNKLVAWWVMLLLSVAIATFGILQDSTAVVIGAMLIAPLMTPIIGTAAAAVRGKPVRISSSLVMVASGVGASIALAFIMGEWAPAPVPLASNSQVTSRVNPNIIDMGIALAAGAAGAFANVNRRVSASIAGVAIAVALVPPLGVVGLTLRAGMYDDASGAFLLFLTNLVSIILAAMVVFALTGFAPISNIRRNANAIRRYVMTVGIAALIIAIPLIMTVSSALSNANNLNIAQDTTAEWLEAEGTDLAVAEISVIGSDVEVLVSGPDDLPPISGLQESLSEALDKDVTVEVVVVPSVVVTYSSDEGETRTAPES